MGIPVGCSVWRPENGNFSPRGWRKMPLPPPHPPKGGLGMRFYLSLCGDSVLKQFMKITFTRVYLSILYFNRMLA
jgi:hypothetical protein